MGAFLILLLALQFFYTTTSSKALSSPVNSINEKLREYSLLLPAEYSSENGVFADDNDDGDSDDVLADLSDLADEAVPLVQTLGDKTELQFRQPIESVNVDYSRNAVVLKFHKNNAKPVIKLEDDSKKSNKRSYEEFPAANRLDEDAVNKNHGMRLERSQQTARDARGDNFMRFGRSGSTKNDFMRFGRGSNDFMRFGRAAGQDFMRFGRGSGDDNFMRFGRAAGKDFMRFGRTPSQDFMRFGRTPTQNFMRFGRTPSSQDFMRFGRTGQDNFMRFGRTAHDNFLRFGRNSPETPVNTNFMRYSRPDNFMRFGRTPQSQENFMRFGKSMENSKEKNISRPLVVKNELKQAVKLIHEADKNADNENPVDKAIKVLFDKHQRQDFNDNKAHSDELNSDNNDLISADSEFL